VDGFSKAESASPRQRNQDARIANKERAEKIVNKNNFYLYSICGFPYLEQKNLDQEV
jgi:hypothetical protein